MKLQWLAIGKSLAVGVAALSVATVPMAQGTRGSNPAVRPDKNAPKGVFVPMPELLKTAGFKVVELPKESYSYMASERAVLPKGFDGQLKAPQNIIMLTYGAKVGGIVRLYQTPAIPGVDPSKLMRKVADLGIFRDVNRRPSWMFTAKVSGGVFVIPTSTDAKTVQNAIAAMKL